MKYRFKPQDMMVPVDGFKAGDIVWSVIDGCVGTVTETVNKFFPIDVLNREFTLYGLYRLRDPSALIFFLDRPGDTVEVVRRGFGVVDREAKVILHWNDETDKYNELYSTHCSASSFFEITKKLKPIYKTKVRSLVPTDWDNQDRLKDK